jgi:hypothetical protein
MVNINGRSVEVISSLIFFFLGFGYSYIFYKNSQKTYEVTVMSDGSFRNNKLDYFYIWNSGKETIYKADLLNDSKCLEIICSDEDSVEYSRISDVTSDYFKLDLYQENNKVKIDFDLLRPEEGFTLMLKTKRKSTTYWELAIKQKKTVLIFPNLIKARGIESNLYLINNLLHFLLICFALYTAAFVHKFKFINLSTPGDYLMIVSYSIYLIMFFVAAPILFKRIKAPRPPAELELHFIKKNKEEQKLSNLLIKLFLFITRKTRRITK